MSGGKIHVLIIDDHSDQSKQNRGVLFDRAGNSGVEYGKKGKDRRSRISVTLGRRWTCAKCKSLTGSSSKSTPVFGESEPFGP
ncbi:hypothetical protein GGP41_006745 [Bipolaris sorokiniana]|uniref:Uncharacterized protein n=1 Tax=Cochliobolus sativus TaxID=45130 RepID=A0A8H6DZQ8_COCSA|nr:hypothetical protein GGP41_006745 [Bipolaris sorokiniana]